MSHRAWANGLAGRRSLCLGSQAPFLQSSFLSWAAKSPPRHFAPWTWPGGNCSHSSYLSSHPDRFERESKTVESGWRHPPSELLGAVLVWILSHPRLPSLFRPLFGKSWTAPSRSTEKEWTRLIAPLERSLNN
ncbi:hypothetical protein V2G26_004775 [Clonostachys chloroleuca]